MNFKQLLKDDDAVSPVIGVILMVAITVILAAVIGTFVLGLGESVQSTAPQASFGDDQEQKTFTEAATADESTKKVVTITHKGGDTIPEEQLDVTVNGDQAFGVDGYEDPTSKTLWDGNGDVKAGSSVTVVFTDSDGSSNNDYATTDTAIDPTASGSDGFTETDVDTLGTGDVVRVVWTSDSGQSSSTLISYEVA